MAPLDLRRSPPRSARTTLLGYAFLARTIDKLRAELPGGHLGAYLNHDTGFSAWLVRRLGLTMDALRSVVADAVDETDLEQQLRPLLAGAPPADLVNAKLETFVASRMSAADRILVRERHPVMDERPDLDRMLDILDAEDERLFGGRGAAS